MTIGQVALPRPGGYANALGFVGEPEAATRTRARALALAEEVGHEPSQATAMGQIERHLRRSGVAAVLVCPGLLMSTMLASADAIRHTGKLVAPAGRARIAMIHPADIAAVAAVALTEDGHEGSRYVLSVPRAITYEAALRASLRASQQIRDGAASRTLGGGARTQPRGSSDVIRAIVAMWPEVLCGSVSLGAAVIDVVLHVRWR